MFPKPKSVLVPNTYAFESEPMVKATGFREYDARWLFNKEINLMFITAVLTIAGYSLTDTVVVFDRIRENLHKNLKGAMHNIFNLSINEVLSRTIVTSFTVFLASASLFFFGGEVIHDFAFALLIGVLVGTYSSVFVASPIVVILENRALAKHGEKA